MLIHQQRSNLGLGPASMSGPTAIYIHILLIKGLFLLKRSESSLSLQSVIAWSLLLFSASAEGYHTSAWLLERVCCDVLRNHRQNLRRILTAPALPLDGDGLETETRISTGETFSCHPAINACEKSMLTQSKDGCCCVDQVVEFDITESAGQMQLASNHRLQHTLLHGWDVLPVISIEQCSE